MIEKSGNNTIEIYIKMPSEVFISHQIELSQDLPNDVMAIAKKQGEDPDRKAELIDEFKQLIYGEYVKQ